MPALDLRRQHRALYTAPADTVAIVDVPPLTCLMIDGAGDPNTAPVYGQAVGALYSLAYAVKFAVKRASGEDFAVMPLEGLWWAADMTDFATGQRDRWQWTLLIVQPPAVTAALVETVRADVARKKALPALATVRLDTLAEGLCAQILHIGPYAAEAPTIARLHTWIDEQGYTRAGHHHEIYLGDPLRTAPERLRTILRQPVVSRQ
ncbi:MAG: GyrI-like domain-containing protein [Chloroflexi bacterium]|nr:GyrI-like domain-containing protein [Chloroflexota bacterium]